MYKYELHALPGGRVGLHWILAPVIGEYDLDYLVKSIQCALAPRWGPVCLNEDSEKALRDVVEDVLGRHAWQLLPPDCIGDCTRVVPDLESGQFMPIESQWEFGPKSMYDELGPIDYMGQRFGSSVAEMLRYVLQAASEGHDYVDNWRACKVGDSESEHYYRKAKDGGCCGSVDTTVGFLTKYRIGFNYGH